MSHTQLTARIVKKLITVWALLPILWDQRAARVIRRLADAGLCGARPRTMLGALLLVAGGSSARAGAFIMRRSGVTVGVAGLEGEGGREWGRRGSTRGVMWGCGEITVGG